jgi:protein-S-isoprenylcysteine O-methyltransferase Ste14
VKNSINEKDPPMSQSINSPTAKDRFGLDRYGRRGLFIGLISIVIVLVILLVSAGTIKWINAWVMAGLWLVLTVIYSVVMIRKNPGLLNERGKFMKEGTKTFDKFFYAFWRPLSIAALIIAGFDAVRYGWSHMSLALNVLGLTLLVLGVVVPLWAMAVNTHFEAFVRIQLDRNHQVCMTGPYRSVRHPGYVGAILTTVGMPLMLGSWWAVIPSVAIVFLFIFRTAMEDRTLTKELSGYKDYTEMTRYRLIPLIW